jgi:gliding motility-associated-like protein
VKPFALLPLFRLTLFPPFVLRRRALSLFVFFFFSFFLTHAQDACTGIWYVTPNGSGDGRSKSSPANLEALLTFFQTSPLLPPSNRVRIAAGEYVISNPLRLTNNIFLEGGYDADWKKTSRGITRIIRNNQNTQSNPPRLVAIEAVNVSGFSLNDLYIQVADADAATNGYGVSVYGIYLNNCQNYAITRCVVRAGNATDGAEAEPGANGRNGANGEKGGKGCRQCDGQNPNDEYNLFGGAGGSSWSAGNQAGGRGGNGGTRGEGKLVVGNLPPYDQCPPIRQGLRPEAGGNGSGNISPLDGVGGPSPSGVDFIDPTRYGYDCSVDLTEIAAIVALLGDASLNCLSDDPRYFGNDGGAGSDGPIGQDGANGRSGDYRAGFFFPGDGARGEDGTPGGGGGGGSGGGAFSTTPRLNVFGQPAVNDNLGSPGGGGGGGGEGGESGKGGGGGGGGGGSFALFLWNSAAGASLRDLNLFVGAPGKGKPGAAGGEGGKGGNGGAGGYDCNLRGNSPPCAAGCEGGRGGRGGKGGDGGRGGRGGNGVDGVAEPFMQRGSIDLVALTNVNCFGCEPKIAIENPGCSQAVVKFTVIDPLPNEEYLWELGTDARPSTVAGPQAETVFLTTGKKTITLKVGAFSYIFTQFVDLPFAGLRPDTARSSGRRIVCVGERVSYQSANNPEIIEYWWQTKGPGLVSNIETTASYTTPPLPQVGAYYVYHKIKTRCCGYSLTDSFLVRVIPTIENVTLNLIATSKTEVCPGTPVELRAIVTPEAELLPYYQWKINGQDWQGLTASPTLRLSTIRDQDEVSVVLRPDYSCTRIAPQGLESNKIRLRLFSKPVANCMRPFPVRPGNPTRLKATIQAGTPPFTYIWDLGNGFTQSGTTSSTTVQETAVYGGSGNYTATLIVRDANGCADTCQTVVEIVPLTQPLQAKITSVSALEGCDSLSVTFEASSSVADAQYFWIFSDGPDTLWGNPVTRKFKGSGSYNAIMFASYLGDVVKDQSSTIQIFETPDPAASFVAPKRCIGASIIFRSDSRLAKFWEWRFSDAPQVFNEASVVKRFGQVGVYTVELKVSNSNFEGAPVCPAQTRISIEIGPTPIPDFLPAAEVTGCAPYRLALVNKSIAGSQKNTFIWDFGDGRSLTQLDVAPGDTASYTYRFEGLYDLGLKIVNAFGCDSSIGRPAWVRVLPRPKAKMEVNNAAVTPNQRLVVTLPATELRFENKSENATHFRWLFTPSAISECYFGADSCQWQFTGGSFADSRFSIDFPQPCNYRLELRVDNGYCADSIALQVRSNASFLEIPNVFSPNGDGVNDVLFIDVRGFEYGLQIYNRWGQEVFSGGNNVYWNGGYKNDLGSPCPEGVYIYHLKTLCTLEDNNYAYRTGTITLTR